MNTIIETRNVNKTYHKGRNKIEAVRDVSISIEKGSSIAIIGPSGAGKSTLLHMLGGLDRPSKGSIHFDGDNLYKFGDRERSGLRNERIGFIFQFYNLLPDFNVLENVIMPRLISKGRIRAGNDIKNRALALLKKMDMLDRLEHRPAELSGGEAQRVAIARALINDPDILLCDEPTGNLDSAMGKEIYDILYGIGRERKMSIVIVTHHENRSFSYDKIYYMNDGQVLDRRYYNGTLSLLERKVC